MFFVTHNEYDLNTAGCSHQGTLRGVTYQQICEQLGEPHGGDGYKTDAEWDLRWEDGTVATIYNWKDGPNYNDGGGTPVKLIQEWNIGAKNILDIVRVFEVLGLIKATA
jgi:hypothetical protein